MARKNIENRLEKMVEGFFARLFKSGLRPIEIGKRILRTIDLNRTVAIDGQLIAPNHFIILLSPEDNQNFLEIQKTLKNDLTQSVREHCKKESYQFLGKIHIEFEIDCNRQIGTFEIQATLKEDQEKFHECLKDDFGAITYLLDQITTLGRHSDSDIVLQEKAASRYHAEIHRKDDEIFFIDKESTNGTYINGQKISEHKLINGDQIRIGKTTFLFMSHE
tara:strand:+ start:420 stop:1079 length:660 start_codon:yes stop_codon:yes gene_type:complete